MSEEELKAKSTGTITPADVLRLNRITKGPLPSPALPSSARGSSSARCRLPVQPGGERVRHRVHAVQDPRP